MKFDIVTIFPRMVEAGIAEGVVGRGVERGLLDVKIHDLREFTTDRHRSVDDVPYGGGPGMVMKPEPLLRAVESIAATRGKPEAVVLLSPQGRPFTQAEAERIGRLGHVVLVCGRYEGMDERVHELVATEELSIGDYVLSGGELAALVVVDAVSRLVPGRGRRRAVGRRGFVLARAAGPSALHAAGGGRGKTGAGRAAVGAPCGCTPVAAEGGPGADAGAAAGVARTRIARRGRAGAA